MPFEQLNVAIQIYIITYVKGVLGLGGGGGWERGCISKKKDITYLKDIDDLARWSFLLYINCINSFTVHSVIGRLFTLV